MCCFNSYSPYFRPACCCRPVCNVPTEFSLGGTVTGVDGPVADLVLNYTVNGIASSTITDAAGHYTIVAPRGATIIITPQLGVGVTVTPASHTVIACQTRTDLNFVLSLV